MSDVSSDREERTEWPLPLGDRRHEVEGESHDSAHPQRRESDPPMEAYRKCERAIRMLLSPHVSGEPEVNSLAAAIMTCSQEYAFAMARIYMDARATYADGSASPEPDGARDSLADH